MLTNVVSLVPFALQQDDELIPFPDVVAQRFAQSMAAHETAGRMFTDEQRAWLVLIRDHVAASLTIAPDDFEEVPFIRHGGLGKAVDLFGDELSPLLDELTEALVA